MKTKERQREQKQGAMWDHKQQSLQRAYEITQVFLDQLERERRLSKYTFRELSALTGVAPQQISELLSRSTTLTLRSAVMMSRSLGGNASLLYYPSPEVIPADVFVEAWEAMGRPTTTEQIRNR